MAGRAFVKNACANFAAKNRSEEHTSELQSRQYLVCRLLLEKKKAVQSDDRGVRGWRSRGDPSSARRPATPCVAGLGRGRIVGHGPLRRERPATSRHLGVPIAFGHLSDGC